MNVNFVHLFDNFFRHDMFFRKIFKCNFFVRKFVFLIDINFIKLTMRFCKNCFCLKIFCCVNKNFEKCVACISYNYVCDLFIFSAILRRIHNKKKRIREKIRKIRVILHK